MKKDILKNDSKIGNHTVKFHSFRSERPIRTVNSQVVRGTKCIIKSKGTLVSEAEVFKKHDDIDNKLVAREFALKKAINNIPNREVRVQLWNEINS